MVMYFFFIQFDSNLCYHLLGVIIQYAFEYEGTNNGRKFLSNEERTAVAYLLLQHNYEGWLKKGTRKLIVSMYSVSVSVIKHIWKRAKLTAGDVSHTKTTISGRKRIQFWWWSISSNSIIKRSNFLIFVLLTFLLLGVNICTHDGSAQWRSHSLAWMGRGPPKP